MARARRDLIEIAEFSSRYWGHERAEIYLQAIDEVVRRVGIRPDLGREIDHRSPGLLRVRSGSHFVIYRVDPDALIVVAILHHRMDLIRHLD